jgi:adenylosuccinate lyase
LRSHWFSRLSRAAARQRNLAIPLIKQLTELVAKKDRDAANFVDWGASSQDIIDTCRVLQLRQALDLIARDLESIAEPARCTCRETSPNVYRRPHLDEARTANYPRLARSQSFSTR